MSKAEEIAREVFSTLATPCNEMVHESDWEEDYAKFAAALESYAREERLNVAREIGGCACAAGIPILKLDDPEDWKRAVKQVKDYARGEERERCAVKCLDLATKWRDISQSRNVTRKERDEIIANAEGAERCAARIREGQE